MSDAQFTHFMEHVGNISNSIQILVNHVANAPVVDADNSTVTDSASIKAPEAASAPVLKTTLDAADASAVSYQSLAIAYDVPDAAPCGALASDVPVQDAHEV